jgi:hypothetical protein
MWVDFWVEPKGGFREAKGIPGTLAFTLSGQLVRANPRDPLFLVSKSVKAVDLGSLRSFAEGRARALPDLTELRVLGERAVKIDGLDGLELTAVAKDGSTGSAD